MKMLVIALLAVASFIIYQISVGSIKHNFKTCIDEMNAQKIELEGTACSERRSIYDGAISCVTVVQKEKMSASFFYGPLGVKNDLELAIDLYNEDCPHAPIAKPKDSLYL